MLCRVGRETLLIHSLHQQCWFEDIHWSAKLLRPAVHKGFTSVDLQDLYLFAAVAAAVVFCSMYTLKCGIHFVSNSCSLYTHAVLCKSAVYNVQYIIAVIKRCVYANMILTKI